MFCLFDDVGCSGRPLKSPAGQRGFSNWQSGWKRWDRSGLICACRAARPARLLPVGQQHAVARRYAVLRQYAVLRRQHAVARQYAVALQHEVGLQNVVQRRNAAVV